MKEYLQDNIKELDTHSRNKHIRNLYRGINEVRGAIVKDENDDLLADSHNILNRWKNYFFQLLNMHDVSDVRQMEVHIAEQLVPSPSCLEVEIAI
jgi:hypothetical protein